MMTTEDPRRAVLSDSKRCLQDVVRYSAGKPMNSRTYSKKARTRRRTFRFVLWDGRLDRRGKKTLVAVVPQTKREWVLFSLQGELGLWDLHATKTLVWKLCWWLGTTGDVAKYIKTCAAGQRKRTPRHYKTTMLYLQGGLFDAISIDFSVLLPERKSGNRYLLVYVKYLNGWPVVSASRQAATETVVVRQRLV